MLKAPEELSKEHCPTGYVCPLALRVPVGYSNLLPNLVLKESKVKGVD